MICMITQVLRPRFVLFSQRYRHTMFMRPKDVLHFVGP